MLPFVSVLCPYLVVVASVGVIRIHGVYVRMHIHVFGNEWDVTLSVCTYMCTYYSSSSSVLIYCSHTCEI